MWGPSGVPWTTLWETLLVILLLFRMFFPFNFLLLRLNPSINVQRVIFLGTSSISSKDSLLFCTSVTLCTLTYTGNTQPLGQQLLSDFYVLNLDSVYPFSTVYFPTCSPYMKIYHQSCPPQDDNQSNPLVVEF